MKPLLAPTIFMMAISSLRPKVASFIVLAMMKTETISSTTMRMSDTTETMFLTVMKPRLISRFAFTSAMPRTSLTSLRVVSISAMSLRVIA